MIACTAHGRRPRPQGRGGLAQVLCQAVRRALLTAAVAIIAGLLAIGASQACSTGKGHAGKTATGLVSMSATASMSVHAVTSSMARGAAIHGTNPCENGSDGHPGSCCNYACCSSCTAAVVGAIPAVLPSRSFVVVDLPKDVDLPSGDVAQTFRPPRVLS